MISYTLTDSLGNDLEIGDIVQGKFANEKVKMLGELKLTDRKEPVICYGNGYRSLWEPQMVERIGSKYDLPKLLPMFCNTYFKNVRESRQWDAQFESILDDYLNKKTPNP